MSEDRVHDDQTLHERVQAGPEFRALRRRMRGFAFPMAAAFLLRYFAFVLRERPMTPADDVGSVGPNLAIFSAFVLVTLVVVYHAGRTTRTASDYSAAGDRRHAEMEVRPLRARAGQPRTEGRPGRQQGDTACTQRQQCHPAGTTRSAAAAIC